MNDFGKVDYADLPIIDLSKYATPEGHAELAIQARDAMTTYGFFYVINHGYEPAQVVVFSPNLKSLVLTRRNRHRGYLILLMSPSLKCRRKKNNATPVQ